MDVAKLAGVSRATASLVIRDSPLVASETRRSVEAAIETLGYVRNLTAARMRAGQKRVIGVVIPNLANPFFAELLAGVEEVLEAEGLAVLLANSHDDEARQSEVMLRMQEHGADGFLLCPALGTPGEKLRRAGMQQSPTVQMLRHVTDEIDYVGPDYRGGMEQAVNHLASLGHQHIAFAVQGGRHSAYRERMEGFDAAMTSLGLDPDIIVEFPRSLPDVSRASRRIVDHPHAPTATICFNDLIAFGLSVGLQDLGIRIGLGHSIAGFDDVMHGEAIRPRLTSIATYPSLIGRRAAEQLMARLEDAAKPATRLVLDTHLYVRESSGESRLVR